MNRFKKHPRHFYRHFYRHCAITLISIAISSLFALIAIYAKPLDPVKRVVKDFSFTDIYYEIQQESGKPDTSHIITLVDMTQLVKRKDIAELIEAVETHSPKVVGLDVNFDLEGCDMDGNYSLIETMERHQNIVCSMKLTDWKNDSIGWTNAIHSFFTEAVDVCEGSTNIPRALFDNMKRKIPLYERLKGQWQPSFVTQIANRYAETDLVKNRREDVRINFTPTVFRVLSPEEVSQHPEMIEGQIVLIGAMNQDTDMHWTPIGKIAGVELMAYGLQSVLYSNEVKTLSYPALCLISLLIILLVEVLQHHYLTRTAASKRIFIRYIVGSTYMMGIWTIFFSTLILGICFLLFNIYGWSVNLAWALTVITFLGTSRNLFIAIENYLKAWRQRRIEARQAD
ncbi:MAG: CHASE2 domain-containing protein [Alloprevotella sp.]